nr:4-coumarate--CoA ligase 1-like [Leptinotarsa decemlineata]
MDKKTAQIDAATGQKDTFESLLQRSIRTAITLKKMGIQKGDIVTTCSDNNINACVPLIASFFIGAIPCSLDPTLSDFEMEELITQVNPKIIFTVKLSLAKIEKFVNDRNLDSKIVVFGSSSDHATFEDFLQTQESEEEFKPIFIENPIDTLIIYFSSGTSGFPKGVCLNHYYFYNHSPLAPPAKNNDVDKERQLYELSVKKNGDCSFLNYGSMYWTSAGMGLFLSIFAGVSRLLCNNFNPEEFWYLIDKYKVSGGFLTPFQVTELVKSGKPDDVSCSSLIRLTTGGAALSKRYFFALQELLPDTDIVPTYAQTEAGMLANFQIYNKTQREIYKKNPESVGLPVRGVWYKVVDPDSGNIVGPNEPGELRIKSICVMNGYYKRDYSNRFDEEGWFRTGDVVYYDENCQFYVVDRLKEMLKYRGWHIPPAILELQLSHHPAVRQSVVIGQKHEEDGDHPMAIVVLHEEYKGKITPEEIEQFIEERVQDKQRLRGGVRFVDSFPMTPSGKVKRKTLKRMFCVDKNCYLRQKSIDPLK